MIKVIFLTLISWTSSGAQLDSIRLETINGKQFIIHQIVEKETLSSISRKYNVPITAILEVNPTADGGLATGQLLKVPYIFKGNKAQPQAGGERIHTVVTGETLYSVSRLYDVSVDDIKTWNNLNDNSLAAGQSLTIKKKSTTLSIVAIQPQEATKLSEAKSLKGVHTVVSKESMYSIARLYGISVGQLKEWNGMDEVELKIGQTLFIAQPKYNNAEGKPIQPQEAIKLSEAKSLTGVHTVVSKESMYSIARLYGITVGQLKEWNGMDEVELKIGQTLFIAQPKYNNAEGKPIQPQEATKLPEAKSLTGVHTVVSKESMYSIARLYGITVGQLKEWNGMGEVELKIGQTLLIAQPKYNNAEGKPIQLQEATKLPEAKSLKGVHTVVSKESMYSIARLYGITVGQLKEWNGMGEVELKIGQTLFIAQPMYDKAEVKTEQNSVTETKEPVELFKEVTPIQTQQETTITISEKVIGSDEVKQGGLAELIEGSEGNRKYLALHRSAKAGTILKVKNELNNREVFVRVAGPLPDTGVNTNVVIKISKSAYDRLGAIDQRFRVEVTYYK